MDSDSPADTSIAGQPTQQLGTRFTSGTCRTFPWDWTGRFGSDSGRRVRGYRGSSAYHRSPDGEGYLP